MALDRSIDIWGRFHDLISGPMAKTMAMMQRFAGVAKATSASTAKSLAGMGVSGALPYAVINRNSKALRSLATTYAIIGSEARMAADNVARSRGRMFANLRARAAESGAAMRWTPLQQGLAATGGYGYALGRGGAGTLGIIGGMMAGYGSWKQFATFETKMTDVRKAANLTRPEMERLGRSLRDLAIDMGVPAADVAGMAEQWALAGARGPALLKALSGETAKAKLVWSGVDSETISNTMAKMYSLWYKDIRDPEEMKKKVSSVIDAIDYLEDNFPTKAGDIIKAFERFMPVAKGSGMTPEQVAAVATSLMVSGPASGERAGTRLAIGWRRMEGLIEGNIKKKGLKISDTATPEVLKAMEKDTMLGVYQWMENLRVKFKGEKGWQKKAVGVIAKGLGFESAKNLEPLLAEWGTTLQIGSIFNQEVARFATKMPWFRERMKALGEDGERLLKTLDDFANSVDGAQGPWIGQASRTLALQKDRAQYRTSRLIETVKKLADTIGASVDEMFADHINSMQETISGLEDYLAKRKSEARAERDRRDPAMMVYDPATGKMRPGTPEEYEREKNSWNNRVNRYLSEQGASTHSGQMVRELFGRLFGIYGQNRMDFVPPWAPLVLPPHNRFNFAPGMQGISIDGSPSDGSLPTRNRVPGSGAAVPPIPEPKPLLSWPGSVPMGGPSIINQHTPAEPIVNQIPPPEVKVINNSPGLVNVNVSVSPAMQSIMRNPGTAAASGAQNDAGASKTGAVGR